MAVPAAMTVRRIDRTTRERIERLIEAFASLVLCQRDFDDAGHATNYATVEASLLALFAAVVGSGLVGRAAALEAMCAYNFRSGVRGLRDTRIGTMLAAVAECRQDFAETGLAASYAAARASMEAFHASVAASELFDQEAASQAMSDFHLDKALWGALKKDRDRDVGVWTLDAHVSTESAMTAALTPRPFPQRSEALRVLRESGMDFNAPIVFETSWYSQTRCLPVLCAFKKLSVDDFEVFLDVVAPDLAATDGARGPVLQHVLLHSQLTYDTLAKIEVLLARLPPTALTAAFSTGLTPLQHVERVVAELRAADECEWEREQTHVVCELYDEVRRMLEARMASA
jgi:hypothetical protein